MADVSHSGGPDDRRHRLQEWREDRIGDRDLTTWPTRLGRLLVAATASLAERARRWLPQRELPWLVLLATALVGGALVVAMTAASAEIYESVVEGDGIASLDQPVLDAIVDRRSPCLDEAVTDFTDVGSVRFMPVVVVVAAVLLCWWWRRWTPALLLAVAAVGSVLMTVVGKGLAGRLRPPQSLAVPPYEESASFPSGHTLNSWVLLLLIAYLVAVRTTSRAIAVVALAIALVLAAAMGLSRVYLGHHWLTDVLVGWTLGTAWLAMVVTGHRLALTVRRQDASRDPSDPAGATEAPPPA
jgi:undecaprenyl-diphosphatase